MNLRTRACEDHQVLCAERVVRAQQVGIAAVKAAAQPPRSFLVATSAHDGDHPPMWPVTVPGYSDKSGYLGATAQLLTNEDLHALQSYTPQYGHICLQIVQQ